MIIPIVIGVFTFLIIVFLLKFYDLANNISRTALTTNSIMIDNSVDDICNKAVIIAEYMSHETKLTIKQQQAKATENACAIVADVLLQHGLNAKDYNIQGLVTIAQHRQGIISLAQYQDKEEIL